MGENMSVAWKFSIVGLIFSLAICSGASAVTTINFDPQDNAPPGDLPSGLSAMSNSPGSTVPLSAQLSNQYGVDGVLFNSSAPYVAVVNVGASSASNPNGIGGVTSGGLLSYADPITFTFVVPDSSTAATTDSFAITADSDGIPGQFATVSAFGSTDQFLTQQTLNDVGGETWTIDTPGIHTVVFNFPTTSTGALTTGSEFGEGTGIELDNLTFGPETAVGGTSSAGAVPLPRMVWGGLAMMGVFAGVRAQRKPTAV
jgi:hypothetical protein